MRGKSSSTQRGLSFTSKAHPGSKRRTQILMWGWAPTTGQSAAIWWDCSSCHNSKPPASTSAFTVTTDSPPASSPTGRRSWPCKRSTHNTKVIKRSRPAAAAEPGCNCRAPHLPCPLNNQCLTEGVIYNAKVTAAPPPPRPTIAKISNREHLHAILQLVGVHGLEIEWSDPLGQRLLHLQLQSFIMSASLSLYLCIY